MSEDKAEYAAQQAIIQLAKLREPFAANHISKLPKPTKAQTEKVKADFKSGIRCTICGAWHHPDVIHLDYVGHAALTDRLLDVDPFWQWEPVSFDSHGLPAIDSDGGLWIRLTICGVTRLGYGDAQGKKGGDAMKERIGDALRNAAMRFGAALDLWHKGGDLHLDDEPEEPKKPGNKNVVKLTPQQITDQQGWIAAGLAEVKAGRAAADWWKENGDDVKKDCTVEGAKEVYSKVVKK